MKFTKKKTIKFLDSKNHNYFDHKKLVYEFNDVFMSDGILFDKNGIVLPETLDEHIFWKPTCICEFMRNKEILNEQIKIRKKEIIEKHEINHNINFIDVEHCIDLTHPFSFYAFGHLYDTLQRIDAGKSLIRPQTKFLVSIYDNIVDFTEHLSIWSGRKVKKEDLILVNNANLKIHNLIFSLSPTIPTEIDKDLYYSIIDQYLNYFNIKNIEPKYNLYLSRNHIKVGNRGVLNEKEVIENLVKKGFIVLTGGESLGTMIEYFANAKTIIGAHGSMFVNCMFCNTDTKIIEFCPNNRICYNFKNTFKASEDYTHILNEADKFNNINISLDMIDHLIRGVM